MQSPVNKEHALNISLHILPIQRAPMSMHLDRLIVTDRLLPYTAPHRHSSAVPQKIVTSFYWLKKAKMATVVIITAQIGKLQASKWPRLMCPLLLQSLQNHSVLEYALG